MTDTSANPDAPIKRTSRLRQAQEPPGEAAETGDSQEPATVPPTAVAVPVAQTEPEPPPAVPVPLRPGPEEQHVPDRGKPIPNSPFHQHDVVQILDPVSRHYGGFFIVGDMVRDRVHGYFLAEGRQKQFVTIELRYCWFIGSAKVRSPLPCSAKWIADYGPRQ
jgi:hypothetical protein